MTNEPEWITWGRALQAMAQNGLNYTSDPYDRERYEAIRRIAAEMLAARTPLDAEQIAAALASELGHATPKFDVRGAVFRDGCILLVREASDGKWTLPGGWAEVGDSPSEAVTREIREESGYETRVAKLVALYDRRKHSHPPHPAHIYKAFFLCELTGGEAKPSIETDAVGFFARDAIPELSRGRVTKAQIDRMFEHARHPDWAADFD